MPSSDRREFLKRAVLGAAVAGTGLTGRERAAHAAEADKPQADRRALGTTIGTEVSILGCGLGSAFTGAFKDDPEAGQALLLHALELGVNYWDTATAYGPSQQMIGPALEQVRDRVFMVSKAHDRTYDGYLRQLENSLKMLRTDHLDLYHLHNLNPNSDNLDAIEQGALRAARKAKEEGMIRHIGITGHSGPEVLMEAIQRFEPDAVMTTFPATRPNNGRYETELLPLVRERKMAAIAMKTHRQATGAKLQGGDLARYALSLEGICVANVGLDSREHLEENAAMATDFKPLTQEAMDALHQRVRLALGETPPPWSHPAYSDGHWA